MSKLKLTCTFKESLMRLGLQIDPESPLYETWNSNADTKGTGKLSHNETLYFGCW